ncbi:putative 2-aminoethylphosphonate ABC transporter substrate-binding protein [Neobacillus mesonae]|uniref:Putative 2-aminoethylphosphonate ABC transporter substrate-binding protein n=1 Tax=Neobacillus mesonae TaxID=1193713 RepID=A0A3Q9QQY7_9BACI|nr:putative 2-aminoethylphosphonate ABC transporter substrate-binding protein [Neobacillus mesonae]AZU60174.1 putative 2-aminoethylphosphonate ABC transporter substrate-binding protein [Neobacillus mesonae]MED4203872.1 putative 2-aminoethylphosphonate ABC transporter substrate-binding protein [Neobacillus mesonae]
MKNHIVKLFVGVISLMLLAACGNSKAASEGGKSEGEFSGELTVYTAIEEELIPDYLKSFNEAYPDIKLNIVRDSTGVITAKLLSEGKNTKGDVVWGLSASSLLALEGKDMLQGYTPKGSDKILPPYKDSDQPEKWIGNTAYQTGIVVNTEELKKRNVPVPKSYEDLVKPDYKDLIVMPHPASSGTGFLTISAWLQMMGEEKAWDFMTKLHENIATYTHSGSKPAKLAAAGEYPIGISLVYSGIQQKQTGAPVEVILPQEGLGWDVEANALIKKADMKNEKLAKAFLDWAITDDVMKKYYDANGFSTMKNDFEKPEGFPEGVEKKMLQGNDLKWAAENRDDILKTWDSQFGKKAEPKE